MEETRPQESRSSGDPERQTAPATTESSSHEMPSTSDLANEQPGQQQPHDDIPHHLDAGNLVSQLLDDDDESAMTPQYPKETSPLGNDAISADVRRQISSSSPPNKQQQPQQPTVPLNVTQWIYLDPQRNVQGE